MASQKELDNIYMGVAQLHATLSKAKRLQVGAALVTSTGVVVPGVNGLAKALGNECEEIVDGVLVTKQECQHAEENVLHKCALEGVSSKDGILYITHAPCRHCAGAIASVGIKRVVYEKDYRDSLGLDILKQSGIRVERFNFEDYEFQKELL